MRLISLLILFFTVAHGNAATTGGHAIGMELGVVSSEQTQMNELIKRANTREGGISTGELNSAYELGVHYMYRFSGSIYALQVRPSFFYQSEDGTGASGTFKYALQGYTVFPMLRLYPMENSFMKFFMQFGLGFGHLSGEIQEGTSEVEFEGNAFGTLLGMGAEFCMTVNHCLSLEGDYRYLSFERNLVTKSTGTFATDSLTSYGKGNELELDNADLSTKMGGLMFMAGYTYWF